MLPADLIPQRVLNLESEVAKLQRRIAQLESLSPGAPPSIAPPTRSTPPPPEPEVELPSLPFRPIPEPIIPSARHPRPIPVQPTPPPLPPPPLKPSAIRELLGARHLLQPQSGSSNEAQIGGWWATRIGALLAVIGVVFFGIYISAQTAPWVKWLELATIAGGVTAGGLWLERKALRVGPVLFGAGLALIFFTAFAAYAVRPVQIVTSPAIGGLLQAAAVALIGFAAWRRASPTTATMAVLLGYVSAFFSLDAGFSDLTGAAGIILALAAVSFRLLRGWSTPLYTSVVLNPVLLLVLSTEIWARPDIQPSPLFVYGFILASFLAHFVPALREAKDGQIDRNQNRIQAINTALSVIVGFVATNTLLPSVELAHFFFGSGLILVAATAWAWRVVPQNGLFSLFAVKAASLLALGAITQWDARTRWVALAVEAIVLLAAAHRTKRNILRHVALIAWFISLLFFVEDLPSSAGDLISASGLAALLYLGASLPFLHWFIRLSPSAKTNSFGSAWALGVAGALPLLQLLTTTSTAVWAIHVSLGLALGFGTFAWRFRSRVAVPGAVLAMVAAHLNVHAFSIGSDQLTWLWSGALPLILISFATAWKLSDRARPGSPEPTTETNRQFGLHLLLTASATIALAGGLNQSISFNLALAITAVATVVITALGQRLPRQDFSISAIISFTIGYFFLKFHYVTSPQPDEGYAWLGFAIAAVPTLWILGSRLRNQTRPELNAAHWIVAIAAVPLIWISARSNLSPWLIPLALIGIGALFTLLGQRLRIPAAYATAGVLGLSAIYWFTSRHYWATKEEAVLTLSALFLLALAIAAQPLWVKRHDSSIPPAHFKKWRILHALAAAWLITNAALSSRAPWIDYGSVLWAIGGIALFALGLIGQARSHRITGLVLLALCIPRIFIYDIEEAKHRIAAFIVLGLLLLWVGFSYQKFRHLIDGNSDETPSAKNLE